MLLGEPGQGKSSLGKKIISDLYKKRFCSDKVKPIFYFSLNPTAWIKESENALDIKNIFILPNEQIMFNGKYQDVILGREHLEESLIFLDGYDELYLKLQENSKNTISFLEDLESLSKYWNLKIIITSRKTCINPSDLQNYGYKICRLTILSKDKQRDWINKKYNKLFPQNKYDIEKLYDSFSKYKIHSKVLELLGIPILLQLIVSNYFYGDAENIVELYDKLFVNVLNTRTQLIIDSFDKNKTENFKQIFELYAYKIYKNNDTYAIIKSKKLKENKNKKWKSILLFYLKNEKKQKKYYIEFVHRSFYQYFQAWYFYNLTLKIVKEKKSKLKERKIINLFKAIYWKKIEIDVINMINQISQNQKEIQKQEQIVYILEVFQKLDSIIKEEYIAIEQLNILDRKDILIYNLLMILNIILPNGLNLLEEEKITQLIKKSDMSDIYLPNINMSGLNLDGINFRNANLTNARLIGTELIGAKLIDANLTKAYLTNAKLMDAHLTWARLMDAKLINAKLINAEITWADLTEAKLQNADLTGAKLARSVLIETNLTGSDLAKANLELANFNIKILSNCKLKDTKISRKRYDEIVALGIDISGIIWCD